MVEQGIAYDINLEKDKKPIYRRRQIETHIGERLNTLLSKNTYQLKDGKIYGLGLDEPFIEVMKSGVGHGKSSDLLREEAEIVGFSKIERILANPEVSDETIMVSISPKGKEWSVYQHNFYDVFLKKEDQIEARRYSAGLSWEEFGNLATQLGYEGETNDVSFLSNPIIISKNTFPSPDNIHSFFHKDHDYLSEEDYQFILKVCLPSILNYSENPSSTSFNAALNMADYVSLNLRDIKNGKHSSIDSIKFNGINFWGNLPVRQTMTGCGFSAGARVENLSFSVVDLAEDKYGARKFDCPDCKKTNIRPKDKLLPSCQHCGSNKVAC